MSRTTDDDAWSEQPDPAVDTDPTDPTTPDPLAPDATDRRRDRRRKLLAVVAALSVVGIGAVVTLATWSDPEYATQTFTAGTFNLQGSSDNSAWADHASSGAAASLSFSLTPAAYNNLTPNDVVYAPFAVRLAANTTSNATLVHGTPTTSGTVTQLTYSLVRSATFTCDASTVSGAVAADKLVTNQAMTVGGNGGNTYTLSKGSPVTNAGTSLYLCFAVTAGASLVQGQTGTVTWNFTATSS